MNNSAIWTKISTCIVMCAALFLFRANLYGQSYSGSTDSLIKALNNANEDTNKIKIYFALFEKTRCSDTNVKLGYALKPLAISKQIGWKKGQLFANKLLGIYYQNCITDNRLAITYFQKVEELAIQLNDKRSEALSLSAIANSYKNQSQYGLALEYYKKVVQINSDDAIKISALSNLGVVFSNVGDYSSALSSYYASLKILEGSIKNEKKSDASDTIQIAGLLFSIGDVYLAKGQLSDALDNYYKAMKLGEQLQNEPLLRVVFMCIGKAYKTKNNYPEAISYLNKGLRLSQKGNSEVDEIEFLDQIANVYLEQGALDTAFDYAQRSMKLAQKIQYDQWLPANYITLGKIYTHKKKYKEAVTTLEYAVKLCQKNGSKDLEKDALLVLSMAYEQNSQPVEALSSFKKFITVRDTLFNISKINEMNRIDLQSKFERDSLQQAGAYQLRMQKQKVYTMSGYLGFFLVILLAFFIYRNYSQQKKANKVISDANVKIQDEKAVSEQLLLNILPEEVAKELKANGSVEARLYDNVTVLFTDFINFTSAAEWFTPEELVAELHTCFMVFDRIMSKYNIEKIKTIGDAYMAAAGLPKPSQTHASDVIKAAFEIRDYMSARKEKLGNRTFGIRIGVNTGTVVAGIVGANKFAYDIWGDTVNIAARMEQYGSEGRINISQSTYELVLGKFSFTDRGEIDAKHKGKLRMYFAEPHA